MDSDLLDYYHWMNKNLKVIVPSILKGYTAIKVAIATASPVLSLEVVAEPALLTVLLSGVAAAA